MHLLGGKSNKNLRARNGWEFKFTDRGKWHTSNLLNHHKMNFVNYARGLVFFLAPSAN